MKLLKRYPIHRITWGDCWHSIKVVGRFVRLWGICYLPTAISLAWAALWYLPDQEDLAE